MFYLGGIKQYRSILADEAADRYPGFVTRRRRSDPGLTSTTAASPAGTTCPSPGCPQQRCKDSMKKYATVDPTTGNVVREFDSMTDAEVEQPP